MGLHLLFASQKTIQLSTLLYRRAQREADDRKKGGRNPTVESGRKLTSILLQEIKGMMEGRSRSSEQLPVLHLSLVIHVCTVMFTSPSVSAGGDDSTTIPLFLMSAGGKTRQ